jgi:hypothetical protein
MESIPIDLEYSGSSDIDLINRFVRCRDPDSDFESWLVVNLTCRAEDLCFCPKKDLLFCNPNLAMFVINQLYL